MRKILVSVLILFSCYLRAAEDVNYDEYKMVHISNISDYPLFVLVEAFHDIDLTQDASGTYKPDKGELKVGADITYHMAKDVYWKVTVSSEKDDVKKVTNKELCADFAINCVKGSVYMYNGAKNYESVQKMPYSNSYASGGKTPKNGNPVHGTIDFVDGLGMVVKGGLSLSSLMRESVRIIRIDPRIYDDNKEISGVRLIIKNESSFWKAGIQVTQTPIIRKKRGVFRSKIDQY